MPDRHLITAAATLVLTAGAPAGFAATSGPAGQGAPIDNRSPSLALSMAISRFPVAGFGAPVRLFAFPLPPSWDQADGRSLSRTEQSELFNEIGTTFGSDSPTTFKVPDLRGRSPIGVGSVFDNPSVALAEVCGSNTVSLDSTHLPLHDHSMPFGGQTQPAGSANPFPFDNRHACLGLNHNICFNGQFPLRNPLDTPHRPEGPDLRGVTPGAPALPYMSQVFLHAGSANPTIWRPANGSTAAISTNTALFSLMGTLYGGNGTTTFAMPDLRARTASGAPSIGFDTQPGQTLGVSGVMLSLASLPSHQHVLGPFGISGPAGGGAPIENRHPSLELTYVIVTQGVYPNPAGFDDLLSYIGEIYLMANTFAPRDTMPCDGRLLSVAQHDTLFQVIGAIYGGDGVNTFALPDLRGRVPVGAHAGLPLGSSVGQALTFLSEAQMPFHVHTFTGPCAGDLNFDGQRNTADLTMFLSHFGQPVPPGTLGDLNGDGQVTTQDLTAFLAVFSVPCP